MDPVAALAFARELIDIDSTTGVEAAAGRFLSDRLQRAWLRRGRAARSGRPLQRSRDHRTADSRALDAFRLRPAVLSEHRPRRQAVRARCVRREGHPGRAGRGGRAPAGGRRAACRAAVRRRGGARQRRCRRRERGRARVAVSRQRGADRQQARGRDARHPSGQAARTRTGGALVSAAALRVGDREAGGRDRRSAAARAAVGPRLRRDVLHRGTDRGRSRAERRPLGCLGRGDVPNRARR